MTTYPISKFAIASVLATATAAAVFVSASHAAQKIKAAGPSIKCSVPNNVKCTVSSSKGIKRVKIQSNTAQGVINVVNKSYSGCPKQVTVGWDSAYPASKKQVIECSASRAKATKATLKVKPARASGPSIKCTVPNNVSCKIDSTKGIKHVKIKANTPQGTINVVNKSYAGCPKHVTVGWDSAYQASSKQIVECTKAAFKAN